MSEDIIELRSADGASVSVHLRGGHVLAWIPASERDSRLYLSPTSKAAPGVAIRGGVPVIFPQFAGEGPLPKHGFARTARWSLLRRTQDGAEATAILRLGSSEETLAIWPQPFELRLKITVGGARLSMELSVGNSGRGPMRFTAALHTYLRVAEIGAVRLTGLQGRRYRDSANGGVLKEEPDEAVRITGEVDRIYLDTPPTLTLSEGLRIEQAGFTDTVVWNPGPIKAAALGDLEQPDGYRRMLCVEAATVGRPVELASGERWTGSQTLTVQPG